MPPPPPPATRAILRAFLSTPPAIAGKTLEPVTIAHVLAWESWRDRRLGSSEDLCPEDITALHAIMSVDGILAGAALAQLRADIVRRTQMLFSRATGADVEAITRWWQAASATALPVRREGAGLGTPLEGLGWALELAHCVGAAYGLSPSHVIYEMPLAHVFAYTAAIHHAAGGKFAGPDYVGKDVSGETQPAWEQDAPATFPYREQDAPATFPYREQDAPATFPYWEQDAPATL
jgi:hypothetical protein